MYLNKYFSAILKGEALLNKHSRVSVHPVSRDICRNFYLKYELWEQNNFNSNSADFSILLAQVIKEHIQHITKIFLHY
jgi:hypothetical protein